jgi:hypothetical protein
VIDAEGVVRYRHVGEITEPVWQVMQSVLLKKQANE